MWDWVKTKKSSGWILLMSPLFQRYHSTQIQTNLGLTFGFMLEGHRSQFCLGCTWTCFWKQWTLPTSASGVLSVMSRKWASPWYHTAVVKRRFGNVLRVKTIQDFVNSKRSCTGTRNKILQQGIAHPCAKGYWRTVEIRGHQSYQITKLMDVKMIYIGLLPPVMISWWQIFPNLRNKLENIPNCKDCSFN